MAIKTFTTGEVLTASDTNTYLANSGLVFVKEQILSATPASTITVTSAFSATYENYRIVVSGVNSSALNTLVRMQLNNSTGATYQSGSIYVVYGGAVAQNSGNNETTMRVGWGGNVSDTNFVIDLFQPFLAKRTGMVSSVANASLTAHNGGTDTNAVSNTGFSITNGADTLANGKITVFGYRMV